MPEMSCQMEKSTKVTGYLEKRGKFTITGRWKKWWCVLEGRLLLYYKSQRQYSKLSPCQGSLNIALAKKIQPQNGRRIHIVTHSQLVILRAPTKEKQEHWFHALINVRTDDIFPLPDIQSTGLTCPFTKTEKPRKSFCRRSDRKRNSSYCIRKCESVPGKNQKVDKDVDVTDKSRTDQEENKSTDISTKRASFQIIDTISRRASSFLSIYSTFKDGNSLNNHRSSSYECIYYSNKRLVQKPVTEISNASESKAAILNCYEPYTCNLFERISPNHNTKVQDETKNQVLIVEETQINEQNNLIEYAISHANELVHSVEKQNVLAKQDGNFEKSGNSFNNGESNSEPVTAFILHNSPTLPAKQKINTTNCSTIISEMNSNSFHSLTLKNENEASTELDSLLQQLNTLNSENVFNTETKDNDKDDEPDYDFPIPYDLLVHETISNRKEFSNPTPSKLSDQCEHLVSIDIAPDSLEMPWMFNSSKGTNWSSHHRTSSLDDTNSDSDIFLDSLNTSGICS